MNYESKTNPSWPVEVKARPDQARRSQSRMLKCKLDVTCNQTSLDTKIVLKKKKSQVRATHVYHLPCLIIQVRSWSKPSFDFVGTNCCLADHRSPRATGTRTRCRTRLLGSYLSFSRPNPSSFVSQKQLQDPFPLRQLHQKIVLVY